MEKKLHVAAYELCLPAGAERQVERGWPVCMKPPRPALQNQLGTYNNIYVYPRSLQTASQRASEHGQAGRGKVREAFVNCLS